MLATFPGCLSSSAVFIAPPSFHLQSPVFQYIWWRCVLIYKSKHSSLAWLSIFPQVFYVSKCLSIVWVIITNILFTLRCKFVSSASISSSLSAPSVTSTWWFLHRSFHKFSLWIINCCINFSMVDTLDSVCAFIYWMISHVAALISYCCSVSFAALPYPAYLASVFERFLNSAYSFLKCSFAFAVVLSSSGREFQFTKACSKSPISLNVYRAWFNSSILSDVIFSQSNCFTDFLMQLKYTTT